VPRTKKQNPEKKQVEGGDVKKREFMNSTGVKNTGKQTTGGNDLQKRTFTNSQGTTSKPEMQGQYNTQGSKYPDQRENKRKFENTKELMNATNEKNKEVKAPKKDYLEGDVYVKYKTEENMEMRKFTNTKKADVQFQGIDKSQDLFLKNIEGKGYQNEIVYSEPKEVRDGQKEKKYQKKREFPNEEQEEIRKEVPDVELDSDGFEIVGSKVEKPKKRTSYEQRPRDFKGKQRKDNKENHENIKGDDEKKGKGRTNKTKGS